jgi:hypothetical protein
LGQQADRETTASSQVTGGPKGNSVWGLNGGCLEIRLVCLAKPTHATAEEKGRLGAKKQLDEERRGKGQTGQRSCRREERAEVETQRWIAWRGHARYELSAVEEQGKGEG